jgi:hypothetical protein
MFTAFLVITVIPLIVIDFLWMFFVETRTGFDYIAISGMMVFHVLELIGFGVVQLLRLVNYQNSFFQFQYGYQHIRGQDDGIELPDL